MMVRTYLKQWAANCLKRSSLRVAQVRKLAAYLSPRDTILLDYPVTPIQRWTKSRPHPEIEHILNRGRERYRTTLETFVPHLSALKKVKSAKQDCLPAEPCWINGGWMPALDGVALYGFIATMKPKRYIEVGSGYSTKFAYMAKRDLSLDMQIVSIDPCPRAEIDSLCDDVIRLPLEQVDGTLFKSLGENDILYIDSSHRLFTNSDVLVAYLEVLPRLARGVIVAAHDIFLPYDYPETWGSRYYTEQYLLAAFLLADGKWLETLFPSAWISQEKELHGMLDFLWRDPRLKDAETHGCSFWMKTLGPGPAESSENN